MTLKNVHSKNKSTLSRRFVTFYVSALEILLLTYLLKSKYEAH